MTLSVKSAPAFNNWLARKLTLGLVLLTTACIAAPLAITPADAKKRSSKRTEKIAKPNGPLTLIISLGRQRISVYDGNRKISGAPISSGKRGHRTPTGIFSVLQKNRRHYSNLYGGAPMPNMQRITWSGVAMHAGALPGYPASHGCIRLPYGFSRRLFGMTQLGTRVIVTYAQPKPVSLRHANLLKPLPEGNPSEATPLEAPEPVPARRQSRNPASELLGISQAHAATTDDDNGKIQLTEKPIRPTGSALTRASLLAYRHNEIIYLEGLSKKHLAEKKAAGAALRAANLEVRSAQRNLIAARKARTELKKTISTATRAEHAASRRMQVFIAQNAALESQEAIEQAAKTEQQIESELLTQDAERAMAMAEISDLDAVIKEAEATLKAKQQTRAALLKASIAKTKQYSATMKSLAHAKGAVEHREKPITVFISRKTMKLHVRRGWDPLMSAPIEIENPDVPLGTHLFSAYAYSADGDDLIWHAVIADRGTTKRKRKKKRYSKKKKKRDDAIYVSSNRPQDRTPIAALDRIRIPDDLRLELAEYIKPGSAMIISDEGIGNETGQYTDIIVQTY